MKGSDAGQLTWSAWLSWSHTLKTQTLAGLCFLGPQTYCSLGVCLSVHVHSWLHRARSWSISCFMRLRSKMPLYVQNDYLNSKAGYKPPNFYTSPEIITRESKAIFKNVDMWLKLNSSIFQSAATERKLFWFFHKRQMSSSKVEDETEIARIQHSS